MSKETVLYVKCPRCGGSEIDPDTPAEQFPNDPNRCTCDGGFIATGFTQERIDKLVTRFDQCVITLDDLAKPDDTHVTPDRRLWAYLMLTVLLKDDPKIVEAARSRTKLPELKRVSMMAKLIPTPKVATKTEEWGHLPQEPCRFCRKQGGVYFLMDDGPEGRSAGQVVRCDKCGRSWEADSSSA